MAEVNSQQANDIEYIEKVRELTRRVEEHNTEVTAKGAGKFTKFVSGRQRDLVSMLKDLTNSIDKPVLKSFATDMIGVLGSFYVSEEMLCCLIKNLLIQLGLQEKLESVNKKIHDLRDSQADPNNDAYVSGLHLDKDNFEFILSESGFAQAIDSIVAIIDIMLSFLELDIKDFVMPSLDFIREITEAAIGFLCIAMQEIIFTLRDAGFEWIIKKIDEATEDMEWAKCLPYMDFITIMKKYIHDYGLTAKLAALMQGFTANWGNKFNKAFGDDFNKNVKVIETLRFIKSVLLKIKESVISMEYCVFLNQDPETENKTDDNPYFKYLANSLGNSNSQTYDHNTNDFLFSDDDTILNDVNDGSNNLDIDKGQNSINVPSNDEVRAFLLNYMGLSADKADQMLADGGLNTGNDGTGTANSCGNILNPGDISSILKSLVESSKVG